ncbi:MAG: hypothetical protein OXH58_15185 [Acidimicrobiaceae bacterium]|nr:hypothetical protein [Acidimicrobiaceae bacterium]MDE0657915.1 hypothetical protein [Acidimicrobiaceae bacterium]
MHRIAVLVLCGALAVGCVADQPAAQEPTTTRPARTTTTADRDFSTCERLNDTIQVIVDDYQAGRVDGHTGLSSIRLALSTMEGLDCGRFSSVIAREMTNMDRTLRTAGY